VVPHGNYIGAYKNNISKPDARQKLGIAIQEFVYLYFGQIREYKQVPHLINCFTNLETGDSRLLIAGNPNSEKLKRSIKKLAENNEDIDVKLSFIPDEDIQMYMNAADIVALPYRDILTSGTAILAMSFGLPVIVPRIGCMPELLSHQSELLYEQGEREALRETLTTVRSADLASIGQKNRAKMEKLDWGMVAERTRDIYLSL